MNYSKLMKSSMLMVLTIGISTTAFAQHSAQTCDQKRQAIEKKISYAKTYHNTNEVNRLQTARAEIIAHCNDKDLQQKLNNKIAKKQQKIAKYKKELAEAKVKGDQHKIDKVQKKLNNSKEELQKLMQNQNHY